MTTIDGRQVRISVEDTVTLADGTQLSVGPVVDAIPSLSPDGRSVSLNLRVKATEFFGYSAESLPRIRLRESGAQGIVGLNEALLLQAQEQPGSDPGDHRKLLILITSTVVPADLP